MYIKNDSLSDTNMRYRNCLVKINGELVKITDIREISSTKVTLNGLVWKNFGFTPSQRFSVPLSEVDWSKIPPQYVNFIPSKGCGLIQVEARARTYALGTSHNNTSVLHAGASQRARVDILPYAISRVSKEFPSKDKAYRQIMEGISPARAISKRVALVKVNDTVVPYILNKPVGVLQDSDNVEVSYKHKYFKEELEEFGFRVNLKEVESA